MLALTAGASDESDRGAGLAALQKCLAELEERPRRVVLLAYAYGYTHEELARQLSTPIGTVKSWVRVGAERGLLQKPALALAVQFQGDHKKHAEILTGTISKMGGAPAMAKKPADYGFPTASLKSQADVLRFAANLEQGAASAYLGAVPAFMSKDLAKYAASILGDEAMHWAVLRRVLGENPVPAAFIS